VTSRERAKFCRSHCARLAKLAGHLRTYVVRSAWGWVYMVVNREQENPLCAVTPGHVCEIARLLLAGNAIQYDTLRAGRSQRAAYHRKLAECPNGSPRPPRRKQKTIAPTDRFYRRARAPGTERNERERKGTEGNGRQRKGTEGNKLPRVRGRHFSGASHRIQARRDQVFSRAPRRPAALLDFIPAN